MDVSGLQNTYSYCLSCSPCATGLAPASSSDFVSTFRTTFDLHTAFVASVIVAQPDELCSSAFYVGENRAEYVDGIVPNSSISSVSVLRPKSPPTYSSRAHSACPLDGSGSPDRFYAVL